MKIAVASGKGGTGKTSVAVSFALSAKDNNVSFVDCDVEEPNGHIFLKPKIQSKYEFKVIVPKINENLCDYCGKCKEICRFNAITVFGKTIMTFKEMCHSCLGCFRVCPRGAIEEGERVIGKIEWGTSDKIKFYQGRIRVGEAMSSPLIKELKKRALKDSSFLKIFDAPPGTSCPVINTIRGVDYVILVTEPTPFGLHDLSLAAKTVKKLGIPMGVIINKAGLGDESVEKWCKDSGIEILMKIPFEKKLAEGYSKGLALIHQKPELYSKFQKLVERFCR